jgi:hypothetical protein
MPILHQVSIKDVTLDPAVKTSAFTALASKSYLVSVAAASIIVTPPTSPFVDDLFTIQDATATASSNTITVDFATAKINGVADTYIIQDASTGNAVTFRYVNSTLGWIIESGSDA